ncbi:MAG: glycosyltransferase family 39 protein [Deltaproteobacteria bacterium]|nr:glycosyltransferase family 39 protein [Deltaproteobacteria bacterium]
MSPGGRRWRGAAYLAGAALCAAAYAQASHHYDGYPQPAYDVMGIPVEELAWQAIYLAYGIPFVLLAAAGLAALGAGEAVARQLARLRRVPRLALLLVLLVPLGAALARLLVLQGQSVTDDEETYLFIARTLLAGRVVNPLPEDPEFFRNQFVVLGPRGWFGKYPIGQGLVLALGLSSGTLDVLQGLLGGATAWLTWLVGRRTLGPRRALLGLALLALSPHFLLTHATLLSQPAVALSLMGATLAALHWERTGRARHAAACGLLVAFGVLVRPMPGVLLALGPLGLLARAALRQPRARVALLAFGAAASLGVGAVALVNLLQSGSPLRSGYQEIHRTSGLLGGSRGATGLSVFGNLWRENFWLFGWPASLLALLAARGGRGRWLLWSPVVAELIYRVLVPKTVVSSTGPTYFLEMVPVLALLAADGLVRLWTMARRLGEGAARGVALGAVSAAAAAWIFFWPVQVRALARGASARAQVWQQLPRQPGQRVLVFSDALVPSRSGLTWAYYPPNPSPDLSDEVLFVRWPRTADAEARARDFARRRFPDRAAWRWVTSPEPRLVPVFREQGASP